MLEQMRSRQDRFQVNISDETLDDEEMNNEQDVEGTQGLECCM